MALAGYYNAVFVDGVPLMVVLLCARRSASRADSPNLAPYTVESYGVNLGSAFIRPCSDGGWLRKALIAATGQLVSPQETAAAVFLAFLFLALRMALVGLSFLFLGVETHGKGNGPRSRTNQDISQEADYGTAADPVIEASFQPGG